MNCIVTYSTNGCLIQDQTTERTIGQVICMKGVYVLKMKMEGTSLTTTSKGSKALWLTRMGHPSSQVLSKLSSTLGFISAEYQFTCCDTCIMQSNVDRHFL
ncbi:Retrovirus-related Pol polyprotein from transposon TNT 1-94 [Sesbania bispinosa]|nr:Retrovirus-related Pol polyprotein from transposon TNT 1-94 [Sesbania bispinosa]